MITETSGASLGPHNTSLELLAEKAKFIRTETVRLTRIAGAGHYSSTFSCAELLAALCYRHLRIEPSQPGWPDRDRFVMSKGHAFIGLYPVLADLGYFARAELDTSPGSDRNMATIRT